MFLLLWKMRQEIEFQKSRALIQALMAQRGSSEKEIQGAFKDLRDAFYPFDKYKEVNEKKNLRDAMHREMKRGALSVTPMEEPKARKGMTTTLARGKAALQQRVNTLSRPVEDVYDSARHRRPRGAS